MADVVCLGILVADVIARRVDELPPRGSLGLVDEISLRGGGCAVSTASVLVRLGLSAARSGPVGAPAAEPAAPRRLPPQPRGGRGETLSLAGLPAARGL